MSNISGILNRLKVVNHHSHLLTDTWFINLFCFLIGPLVWQVIGPDVQNALLHCWHRWLLPNQLFHMGFWFSWFHIIMKSWIVFSLSGVVHGMDGCEMCKLSCWQYVRINNFHMGFWADCQWVNFGARSGPVHFYESAMAQLRQAVSDDQSQWNYICNS